jgi:hypothetical protein
MFGYKRDFGYIKKQNPLKKACAIYPMTGGGLVQKTATNLVKDGTFTGSVDWETNGASTLATVSDGIYPSEGEITVATAGYGRRQLIPVVVGHLYYETAVVKVVSGTSGYFGLYGSGGTTFTNTTYQRISKIRTATDAVTRLYFLKSADAGTIRATEVMVIDLTAIYEASKTPTVGQCGYFFPDYFSGAKTLLLPENPATQELEDTSKPRVNLIPVDKQRFEGWFKYGGATVTLTQNQYVPEWGTSEATRIQSSGGSDVLKYYHSLVPISVKKTPYAL